MFIDRLKASAAGLVIAAFGVTGAQAQDKVFLNLGATPTASSFFSYFVAAGQAMEKGTDGRMIVNVMETGSSVDNLRRLRRGEIELGLATTDVVGQAARAIGVFSDEDEWPDLRLLYVFTVVPNIYTVRADAGVTKLEDLSGKRYNAGIPGSSTEAQTLAVMETLGLQPDLYKGTTADAIAAVRDKAIIGYTKSSAGVKSPDSSFVELSTSTDVRVLGFDQAQIDKVREVHPYYSALTVPAGVYPEQTDSFMTLGTAPGMVTAKDALTDDDAYAIVKAIMEHRQLQDDAFPAVVGLDFNDITMKNATVPLHAGAVRYFREAGIEVPEDLVPPEAK